MNPFAPQRAQFEIEQQRINRQAFHVPITLVATGGGTTLYTARDDFLIKSLWVSNITGSAATLGLYVGTVADGNAVLKGFSVAANSLAVICSPQGMQIRLRPAVALIAVAGTGSALTMGGWGIEISGGDE